MEKIKKALSVLRYKQLGVSKQANCMKFTILSAVFFLAAMGMLILNMRSHSTNMAYASVVLVVGFAISLLFAWVLKKDNISALIVSLLVGFVLSYFAISGGNAGFAILWVLLVPVMAIGMLGIVPGAALSTYFLIFLFLLFYSPMNGMIVGKYTEAFAARFPVLYLSDYLISLFMMFQKEYYFKRANQMSYLDELTGIYNRRFFMQELRKLQNKNVEQAGLLIVDLNGLKKVNDSFGHDAGDDFIKTAAHLCEEVFGKKGIVARMGGDEFAILIYEDTNTIEKMIVELKQKAANYKFDFETELAFAIGFVHTSEFTENSADELYNKADERMYADKSSYYRQKGIDRRNS